MRSMIVAPKILPTKPRSSLDLITMANTRMNAKNTAISESVSSLVFKFLLVISKGEEYALQKA